MLYHGKEIRYHEGGNDKNCYSSESKSRGKCNILLSGPNEVAMQREPDVHIEEISEERLNSGRQPYEVWYPVTDSSRPMTEE
jgi:hypothetical protein